MSRPSSSRITVFDENAAPSARQSGLHRLAPPMARVPSVSSSTRGSKIIPRSPVRASRAKISSPSRKITYERSSSLKQEKPVAEEVKKIKEQVAGLETIRKLFQTGRPILSLTIQSDRAAIGALRSRRRGCCDPCCPDDSRVRRGPARPDPKHRRSAEGPRRARARGCACLNRRRDSVADQIQSRH